MYNPEDIHGFSSTSWVYSPTEENRRLREENKELKEKIESLEKLLSEYTRLHGEDNFNYIDGHCCYREITDAKIENVEMKSDYSGLYFDMKCEVVYKDIDTHEVVAIRYINEGIEERP